jgi:hypothetical protein
VVPSRWVVGDLTVLQRRRLLLQLPGVVVAVLLPCCKV